MPPTEQIEFSQSVEGLFIKGLGAMLTPPIREKLRAKGLDLDKPLRPGYPAVEFHRWIEFIASIIYPDDRKEEAVRRVGHRAVSGLEEGLIGKALSAGLKLIGPRRSLQRVERIFKNNNNYQVATLLELGERDAKVQLSEVFGLPTYYQGLFEAAVAAIGAKEPRVTVLASPAPGAMLHIEWTP
ncbi:MAG: DUF2378 family protein [Archangium sp.]|nr:DUF2378 family protein [Archangium sp.]MDP3157410.1 DUF2378 family protein [Archangium sp.]MDP3572204.1 DUF2378 family protein [Archangium sp.]